MNIIIAYRALFILRIFEICFISISEVKLVLQIQQILHFNNIPYFSDYFLKYYSNFLVFNNKKFI